MRKCSFLVRQNNLMAISQPSDASRIVELEDGKYGYVKDSCFFGPFDSHEDAAHFFQLEQNMVSQ